MKEEWWSGKVCKFTWAQMFSLTVHRHVLHRSSPAPLFSFSSNLYSYPALLCANKRPEFKNAGIPLLGIGYSYSSCEVHEYLHHHHSTFNSCLKSRQPHGGARENVRGLLKSFWYIIWGPWKMRPAGGAAEKSEGFILWATWFVEYFPDIH